MSDMTNTPNQPPVQPPTREQIAETIYTVRAGSNEHWHKAAFREDYLAEADAVLALFPQPTPSAEHHDLCATRIPGMGIPGLEGVPQPCNCYLFAPEPVSIADMAPGTMNLTPELLLSTEGHDASRYVPGSLVSDGHHMTWTEKCRKRCKHTRGECFQARSGIAPRRTRIDPSTIRDVTPPPATPEEGA
jgi:hypothetical protein